MAFGPEFRESRAVISLGVLTGPIRPILSRAARAALIAVLMLAGCTHGAGPDGVVHSRAGAVRGTVAADHVLFQGIPYGAPPVGPLRWQPPQEPEAWNTARTTTAFANACAQYGRIYGPGTNNRHDETIATTLNQAVGSEDCLYLNVWRPANNDSNLPVIVFLHGGSNVSGYTADPVYDGANLARTANAIVVTPNFRLGILGFMNLPQLKTGDASTDSGNFTMLDSIKALQFVRTNSSSFGGNPDNVTVVGQSAGGHTALSLAGGRWSPGNFRRHCQAHLEEDFSSCAGYTTRLQGNWLDGLKKQVVLGVHRQRFDDDTWYTHEDPRIAAVIVGPISSWSTRSASSSIGVGSRFTIARRAPFRLAFTGKYAAGVTTSDEPSTRNRSHPNASSPARSCASRASSSASAWRLPITSSWRTIMPACTSMRPGPRPR